MKIVGLTTCVGNSYAQYLNHSLPVWLSTLDQLLVVTDDKTYRDNFSFLVGPAKYLRTEIFCLPLFLRTDVFTRHGASFNKGAALAEGFATIRPDDWVLNFDADIEPPRDWRAIVEGKERYWNELQPQKLYGLSHRYREDGSLIPDADYPNIWGFWHLWNIASPFTWNRPVFDPTCGHAGNYDHEFMIQFPPHERVDLWPALKVIHHGEPRQQWFGRDPKNEKRMNALFMLGLWDAWQTRAGHIKPPDPIEVEINGDVLTSSEILEELDRYTDPDVFKYKVTVKHAGSKQ